MSGCAGATVLQVAAAAVAAAAAVSMLDSVLHRFTPHTAAAAAAAAVASTLPWWQPQRFLSICLYL